MEGSSFSSSRTDPFDPYAFAVRWYEEHPEVLHEYEKLLKRMLNAGFTLDELEEIEAKAFEFGRLARRSGVTPYKAWLELKGSLPRGTKAEAKEAYYRGYVL